MVDGLSVKSREAGGLIGHESSALSASDGGTEVGIRMLAVDAGLLHALWRVAGNDHVSHCHTSHSWSHTLYYSSGFVAENDGENAFGITSVKCINIGVAEGIRDDLDPNFSSFWWVDVDLLDLEGSLGLISNCSLTCNPLWLAHLN